MGLKVVEMNYWEEYENRIETEEKNPEEFSINIFKIKSEWKQVFDKPFARTGRIILVSVGNDNLNGEKDLWTSGGKPSA